MKNPLFSLTKKESKGKENAAGSNVDPLMQSSVNFLAAPAAGILKFWIISLWQGSDNVRQNAFFHPGNHR